MTDHVNLETVCGEGDDSKVIKVSCLKVDALSPYNIILSRFTINELGAIISTLYWILNYHYLMGESRQFEKTNKVPKSVIRAT